jgi:hypothetical protein
MLPCGVLVDSVDESIVGLSGYNPSSNPITFPKSLMISIAGAHEAPLYPIQLAGSDHPEGRLVGTN